MIGLKGFFRAGTRLLIEPKSSDEDSHRKEFILNVILLGSLVLLLIFDCMVLWQSLSAGESYEGMSFCVFSLLVAFIACLYIMSRLGYFKFSAYIFVTILFLLISYSAFKWGIDLPSALMGYSLVVITSSILIGINFGFWLTCLTVLLIILLGLGQINGQVLPDNHWKRHMLGIDNIVEYTVMLFFLTVVSWLSNREIEKSLFRARNSEFELKVERDSLEFKVGERTRELREIQHLQLSQHSQFVELGRLAGGYVHDLANPLTVLSLSIEQLNSSQFGPASEALNLAMESCKRMENLLITLRRQLKQQEHREWFSVCSELTQAARLLGSKAAAIGVEISINLPEEKVFMFGSASKFHQIITNLMANAIESYSYETNGKVLVILEKYDNFIKLVVEDFGCGIDPSNMKKIFEPMFTTKGHAGLGMGLSTVKSLIENDFNGLIVVTSRLGQGTLFSMELPLKAKNIEPILLTGSEDRCPPPGD